MKILFRSIAAIILLLSASVQQVAAIEHLTITTTAGGQVQKKVLDSDFDGLSTLSICGPIDASDWAFLTSNSGIIAMISHLDLAKARLVCDGSTYISRADTYDGTAGMGSVYYTRWNAWPRDSISTTQTLDGTLTTYWGNNICCGFIDTDFEKVTLPDNIYGIGQRAFDGCKKLKEVIVGDNVKYIDYKAFNKAESLKKINIPNSLKRIGNQTFSETTNLETIDLNYVTEFGGYCFSKSGLKQVVIPEETTNLYSGMFAGCQSLESVSLPNSVVYLGEDIFQTCVLLGTISLPEGIQNIPDYAFSGCKALTLLSLPSNVSRIGASAFKNCANLNEIILP